MPLYMCNAAPGAIPSEAKAKIAKEITDIHCDVTDAPATFVHVFFFEGMPAPVPEGMAAELRGSIRANRTDEQKQEMIQRMQQSIALNAGAETAAVSVELTDVPASWVMEGGDLLPEPGEEEAWLAAHEAKLAAEASA